MASPRPSPVGRETKHLKSAVTLKSTNPNHNSKSLGSAIFYRLAIARIIGRIAKPHDLNCRGVARLCRFHSEAEKELRVRP